MSEPSYSYDFSDEKIRDMVDGHRPHELYARNGMGTLVSRTTQCDTCSESWPCSAIRELRAWYREFFAKQ